MERDGRRPVKLVAAELPISELRQAMKDSHKADQNELVRVGHGACGASLTFL